MSRDGGGEIPLLHCGSSPHRPGPAFLRRLAPIATLLLFFSLPLQADVDISAYQTEYSVRDARESSSLQQEFDAARQRETAHQQAEAERRHQAAAAQTAAAASRPYPERLTFERCTRCHEATHFTRQRHTRIVWHLVTLRMQLLNDAPMTHAERDVIADYLGDEFPADAWIAATEVAAPALVLVPAFLLTRWIRRRRSKTKTSC